MSEIDERIGQDTEYCTYCPKLCRFACPVAETERRETVIPWALMRLREFTRTGDVAITEEVAEIWGHCTGCLRCNRACLHDNDVPRAMWHARAEAYERGLSAPRVRAFLERFAELGAPEPLAPTTPEDRAAFDPQAPVAYLPDCRAARRPGYVGRVGRLLHRLLGAPARLLEVGCCGAPLLEGGDRQGFEGRRRAIAERLEGAYEVVTECGSIVEILRDPARLGARPDGAPWPTARHLIELASERAALSPPPSPSATPPAALFDACYLGRRLGLARATRALAELIWREPPPELWNSGDEAWCCGAGGLYPEINPPGARGMADRLLAAAAEQGSEAGVLCGSERCTAHINAGPGQGGAISLIEALIVCYESGEPQADEH